MGKANAIAAKVSSLHGQQLKEEDYEELLSRHSVPEIAAYLKNETHYRDALRDVRENNVHRGQLEDLLRKDVFREVVKLYRYADRKEAAYYRLYIEENEIRVILETIRMMISAHFDDVIIQLPLFLKEYASYDIMRIGAVRCFDDLLDVLARTPYAALLTPLRQLKGKESEISYTACEHVLMKHFYSRVMSTIDNIAKGTLRSELHELHGTDIELKNMEVIYRLKHYYHAQGSVIRDTLYPFSCHVRSGQLEEMIAAQDEGTLLQLIRSTWYHLDIPQEAEVDIGWYMDAFRYRTAKRKLYYSQQAPVVFGAYIVLQRNELANLTRIIEGIRYQLPAERIKAMLIY